MAEAGGDPAAFGRSFKNFMDSMTADQGGEEPPFVVLLREHFGADPESLVIVSESFSPENHPNVQLAIDEVVSGEGVDAKLVGIHGLHVGFGFSMSSLLTRGKGPFGGEPLREGPVLYTTCQRDKGSSLSCVQLGLFLIGGATRAAMLVRGPSERGFDREVVVEVMTAERSAGEELLRTLRRHVRELNVYRGKVISLSADRNHYIQVRFHDLPEVDRASIVLPEGVLERIERHTIRFSELAGQLRAAGRHLKRGLLLHGPPGTGKTLTAMYLASRMENRTVLVITGRGAGLVEHACSLARYLEPATVILEDADLIATERSQQQDGCGVLLFELLNQMDGLGADTDVLFVLTTNRPDVLEPALAARPGRIDQAIEIALPGQDERRRLIELYAEGITLEVEDLRPLLARSQGTSGAFIRELLRKATLLALDEHPDAPVVRESHLDAAFRDLVVVGGELTRSLLGARPAGEPS